MTAPDRYAVLGHPVAHSQSPFIHAEFARQTGEALEYGRVECPLDGFEATLRAYAAGGARGCNVTVPFKFEAPRLAARVTPRAALAEAANVLRFDAGGWAADNSDGIGLVRDLEQHAAQPVAGQRVLLIGAGGAAAGVLGPLIEARAAAVSVVNRTPQRAAALVARHAVLAAQHGVPLSAAGLDMPGARYDIVLNASASSLAGAAVPVTAAVLAPGALAVDLMYGPAAEPFLAWARAAGARAHDGLGMLVEQAAEAFWFWRGVRPQTAPVLAALRARLAARA
ncbi:shikimate dehydrogenase [Rubrivivax gelatinosus]|uniref:Shikimate dehydrogenase (NADP(+)) n=1 Tax=Rubrivivax gelatinosus TaxID=28068 RepID=A0ABS1DSE1_RUBGE|nr:shikimate dehydrogenase [Rubrivivax gelatinosus]MBK1613144.1 shikimate dehydrogenase [Rubrivivax gelatinosus]MBK1712631.1 shikimate dehydrogenase [Rubrivivax gelatinosus]